MQPIEHDYEVYETEDGNVGVKLGEELRLMSSRNARHNAHRLAVGADIAADQHRGVSPGRYGLPGDEPIPAELAYWLVWQIIGVACEIDMMAGERLTLGIGEPDVIHIIGAGGEIARIVH